MEKLSLAGRSADWTYIKAYDCYVLEMVVYCQYPAVPRQQCMNIYVPALFLDEAGNMRDGMNKNGYTARTVPVIFENGLAGYQEAEPFGADDGRSAAVDFLKAGFVYVSCGCRGRSSTDKNGTLCGKSPASLVDLKAGIRFLKGNAAFLPGDMNKIVSVGISAGGAMSALLGSTGNSKNYVDELKEIGALMEETDDVFAAQCYCPIIDLDHADFAYEWMFLGRVHYDGMPFVGFEEGILTPFCQALSDQMGRGYVDYFNALGLKHPETGKPVKLECGHGGSGYAYLMKQLEKSASRFFKKLEQGEILPGCGVDNYLHGKYETEQFSPVKKAFVRVPGVDKSGWLSWDGKQASITSLADMQISYLTRLKKCPAFDDLELIQAENQEFGTPEMDRMHFNTELFALFEKLSLQFPQEVKQYLKEYQAPIGDTGLAKRKYLINPLNYVGTGETCDLAPHFRIRVGSRDADTSMLMTVILALKLMQTGKTDVDYKIVWDEAHGRADYPGEVTAWVADIGKL